MQRLILMLTLLALAFSLLFAQAQTADVIGQAGQLGYQAGTRGAVANRRIADQLYKQALEDERRAWASTPPNVSLLAKALQASKDAKAADDQAKEHARAALHASNTGAHSGDFIHQRYGIIGEGRLKELATTNSPYQSQVEKTLGGYGLKLSPDKMILQTPFGKFSVNPDDSTLLKVASRVAEKLGYPAEAVSKGQQQAFKAREEIAKRTIDALDKELKERGRDTERRETERAIASIPGAEHGAGKEDGDKVIGAKAGAEPVKNFDGSVTLPVAKTLSEAEIEVLNQRKALGRELGLGEVDPLGRKTQDIFQMVHSRYQSLRLQGAFYAK